MKKINIKINPNDITIRNEMHFQTQLNTRSNVFKDKTKYTRKQKHKERLY